MVPKDSTYFHELQSHTGWGRTLFGFATWCAPQPGWRVLDVGCGPGLLPSIFAKLGCQAMGIDLDEAMFQPNPLHPLIAVADVYRLPFRTLCFDLITATNLIFLLDEPVQALCNLIPFLARRGRIAMLNPSDSLNEKAAVEFAKENGLQGLARETLVNWARRAAAHQHWTEKETFTLYYDAGMKCMGSVLKIGPGFGRYSWGMVEPVD